jgi:hypothetical protein
LYLIIGSGGELLVSQGSIGAWGWKRDRRLREGRGTTRRKGRWDWWRIDIADFEGSVLWREKKFIFR